MIRFTQLPVKLSYPPAIKAKLSTLHSDVITYVSEHFKKTHKYKSSVINLMNTLSYIVVNGEYLSTNWSGSDPFHNVDLVDDYLCKESLGNLYILEKNVDWSDLVETASVDTAVSTEPVRTKLVVSVASPTRSVSVTTVSMDMDKSPTSKEDLYIKPPTIPQFDVSQAWCRGVVNGTLYTIYPSLPRIPKKQNEISVTTEVDKMTSVELMKLYPNRFIPTRSAVMYQKVDGLEYDEMLGIILPIEGFTSEQVRDNIIKYPHLFRLTRQVDNKVVSLYTTIEIEGELHRVADVWSSLPESNLIPRNSEFVKEYVVRRYLLERDIKGIKHIYPIFGSLDPFLTLFTTPEEYAKLGYTDAIDLAIQCVKSRVLYKQSRNPILRRLSDA